MKVVIIGCGRVGAALADAFDGLGHDVTIIDTATRAFDRLSDSFKGQAIRGDGTDEDVLRRAGAEDADIFVALTEGDNRNIMATQVAMENLGAKRAVAKINDPVRAAAYAELGIATVCRTTMLTDALLGFLGVKPTGMPSVIAPVPHVHDDGAPKLGASPLSGSGAVASFGSPGRARSASGGGTGTEA
jgi:trk system potassium uptake protein TrkA